MKKIIACIATMFVPLIANAFDYVVIAPTGPLTQWTMSESKPNKGSPYVDLNAHTTAYRVTNYATDDTGLYGVITEYTFDCRSSDGKYLLLQGLASETSGSSYYVYSATPPYGIIMSPDDYKAADAVAFLEPEYRWDNSGSHPTWLYYRAGKQLRYIDISDNSDNLVHDFNTEFPTNLAIQMGDEGYPSENSRYWGYMTTTAESTAGNPNRVFTYDKTNDVILSSYTTASWGSDALNSVYMSKSGKYVFTSSESEGTAATNGANVFISSNMAGGYKKIHRMSKHVALGYTKQGNECAIYTGTHDSVGTGDTDQVDTLQFTRLDTGITYPLIYQGTLAEGDEGWTDQNDQFHCPGYAKRGWCFVATYSDLTTPWSYNQMFAFELDETRTEDTNPSNRIWRVCATQNASNSYYSQPNISVTNDGTAVYWTSPWRTTASHSDVYCIDLPSTWYTDFGGETPAGGTGGWTIQNLTITNLGGT